MGGLFGQRVGIERECKHLENLLFLDVYCNHVTFMSNCVNYLKSACLLLSLLVAFDSICIPSCCVALIDLLLFA